MVLHLSGRFFELLLAANRPRLAGFKQWLFHPGMLFQSREQWWGQKKPRSTPHEGLDLCWFEDVAGSRQTLDQTTVIPAPFPGTVVKITPDFLGQSIFLTHALVPVPGRRLLTAFGHASPREGLTVGEKVAVGDILATVSAPANRKASVPPHLHITLALIPDGLSPEQLAWKTIGTDPTITLLDPLAVFPTSSAML
jgi:hypothetical protein